MVADDLPQMSILVINDYVYSCDQVTYQICDHP
jgi:hypothetical protein